MSSQQRRDQSESALRVIAEWNNGLLGCAQSQPAAEDHHDDDDDTHASSETGYGT
jgi:hypothetical protein